ncbi:O-antigen ligase family protein [Neobacillus sp.]|uniref:O-antigen ligase family protein n=1 Tax=Neobacillus sp. TaxID=2675273 RepID=UPI00289FA931|nr:O-antigen ligase family protein [Neobacillus sp.]
MKLLQSEFSILLLGILAVIAGLVIGNTKIALLISLLIAICSFFKKETGLFFLLVFIPVRPFLITVNPGFKIIGDAIIGLLLIRTIFDYRKDIKKLFSFQPFEWAFFSFAIIGVVGALITDVSIKAIIFQLRAYFLFYVIYYVVKRMELTNQTIWKGSIITFFVAIVVSFQGIIEKISSKTLLMPQEWQEWVLSPTNRIRVYGLIKGPNELSLYLLIAFFITLYMLKHIQGKLRYAVYAGLTLIGTTILLTYSRGTLLTLFAFLIVYIASKIQWKQRQWKQLIDTVGKRQMKQLIPLVLISFISMGLFIGVNQASDVYYEHYLSEDGDSYAQGKDKDNGIDRYKNAFGEETIGQSSTSGRIYYVKKAIEIFKDHPIIGTGFGTFGGAATLTYSSPVYEKYHIDRNFYSDNQYILILAETGILGILSIFMVGFFLLSTIMKNRDKVYGPLLIYFFVALIVGSSVYNILENDSFMMYFYLLFAIAYQKSKSVSNP